MADTSPEYRIVDEPPGGIGARGYVVNPGWPLIAIALSGAVPGLLWLAYNAYAINSATRDREFTFVIFGILGAAVISGSVFALADVIPSQTFPYVLLILVTWKMMAAYFVHLDQERSLELFEYYGGRVRGGFLPMIAIDIVGRIIGLSLAETLPAVRALFYDRNFLW